MSLQPKSNSSIKHVGLLHRIIEWAGLLKMRLNGTGAPNFQWLWDNLGEYDRWLQAVGNTRLKEARVLEIGFGARPLRLIAMQSMGINAAGVDLDAPILKGSFREFSTILRKNGLERFLKSSVRFLLFDRRERIALHDELESRGHPLGVDAKRFYVADAASDQINESVESGSLDLIVSEDVFEHIPRIQLPALIANMKGWLSPSGVALVRPNIFTGITGSHLLEWYAHEANKLDTRRSEPWEHLRQRRFRANTFLNEVTRAEFRNLFAEHFDIVTEEVTHPLLGNNHFTEEVKKELAVWTEEELFSNQVLFVPKPKK